MWDPPGPGLEPVSPALAGGFLTTVTPGKSYVHSFACDYPVFPELFIKETVFPQGGFLAPLSNIS